MIVASTITNGLHIEAARHLWLANPCKGGKGFASKYHIVCQAQYFQYQSSLNSGQLLRWMAVLPTALLGLLLGVNLVAREMDRNYVRLAWTQSVSRTHWFISKTAVGLTSLTLFAVPLCVTESWWFSASRITPRLSTNGFTYAGWMPLAIGVFAFATATFIGTILRRPGWTIAAALAVMVVVTFSMQAEVRTNLVPLRSTTLEMTTLTKGGVSLGEPTNMAPANAWVVFSGYVPIHWGNAIPSEGQETQWRNATFRCPANFAHASAYTRCLKRLDLRDINLYVSNNEYWTLQLREGALYLSGAALLFGVSLLLVRRIRA